jgi:hypothetical protein
MDPSGTRSVSSPAAFAADANGPAAFAAAHADHLTGRLDAAAAAYRALLGTPDEVLGTRTLLAAILRAQGVEGEADTLERGEIAPLDARARARLGRALLAMDDPMAARTQARTLVELGDGDAQEEGLLILARANLALGDRSGAETALWRVLEGEHPSTEAVLLLARLLRGDGRVAQALDMLTVILARRPDNLDLARERARILLARGQWAEGWAEWAAVDAAAGLGPKGEPWDVANPEGVRVLLRAGESIEETLLFLRFAGRLAKAGAVVSIEAPESILPLLTLGHGIARLGPPGGLGEDHDHILPLSALPGLLGVTPESLDGDGAYLEVSLDRILDWGARLEPGLNLGLDWSAGPPLEDLAPLLTLPGVNRIALAWADGPALEAAEPWGGRLCFPLGPGGGTLLDLAGLLFSMDLVVTSESMVAHLAGALGRPCWVLLPVDAEWYWGSEGETTPWYPSLRLFRQDGPEDWRGPVWAAAAAVGRALGETSRG